jgi:hypothetical protein
MAFGTGFPPKFWYPSKVHRYKPPLSVPPLQTGGSAAAPAVPDVPTAITATMQTNAQVKARELIIVLVNFVFILFWFFLVFFSRFVIVIFVTGGNYARFVSPAFLQTVVKVLNGPVNFPETF